ncbi:MAG: hypothetical protein IJY39_05795 [Clostridia bacterium]|nr:hypothetical protein [Clostridia bacterium]
MSKSTISALKTEIRAEFDAARKAEDDLKHLDRSIGNAMDDRVGQSARESLSGILNRFSLNIDQGLQSVDRATGALDRGYARADGISAQAEAILSRARSIVKELGEI